MRDRRGWRTIDRLCVGVPPRISPMSHPTRRSCTIYVERSTSRLPALHFLFPMRGGESRGFQRFLGSNSPCPTPSSNGLPRLMHPITKPKVLQPADCRRLLPQPTPIHSAMPAQTLSACPITRTAYPMIEYNSSSISSRLPSTCPFSPSARALHALCPLFQTLPLSETRSNTKCIRFLAHELTIHQLWSLGFIQ